LPAFHLTASSAASGVAALVAAHFGFDILGDSGRISSFLSHAFLEIAVVSQPRTQSMVTPSYVHEIDYPEADDGGGNAKDQNIADAMSGNSLPRTNRR
jgi:hypothetical protein